MARRAEWRWILGVAIAVALFIGASLVMTMRGRDAQQSVDLNRDALVTVCSSMAVLRIVFEQLQIIDRQLGSDPLLSRSTRARVRQRASLYGTAIEALSETNTACRQIE